jgi:hypothetical protein
VRSGAVLTRRPGSPGRGPCGRGGRRAPPSSCAAS